MKGTITCVAADGSRSARFEGEMKIGLLKADGQTVRVALAVEEDIADSFFQSLLKQFEERTPK